MGALRDDPGESGEEKSKGPVKAPCSNQRFFTNKIMAEAAKVCLAGK